MKKIKLLLRYLEYLVVVIKTVVQAISNEYHNIIFIRVDSLFKKFNLLLEILLNFPKEELELRVLEISFFTTKNKYLKLLSISIN